MIRQENGKWCLYSKDGKKKLGTFDTEAAAKAREAEILRMKSAMKSTMKAAAEAMADGSMSYSEIQSQVRQAFDEQFRKNTGPNDPYVWVQEVYPSFIIIERGSDYFKRSYAAVDGKVTFGDKETQVERVWVEVSKEALREALEADSATPRPLREMVMAGLTGLVIEDTDGGDPVVKGVTVIQPGESQNRNEYGAAMLQRDGPSVFEATPAFVTNHNPLDKTLKTLVGVYEGVRWEDNRLKADLHGLKSERSTLEKAVEAAALLGSDRVGLSIDTAAAFNVKRTPKGTVREVTRLVRTPKTSIDIVINPSAGGRLTESLEESDEMNRIALLTEAILIGMSRAAVQLFTEGISDDEIRQHNPNLAETIIGRRDGTVVDPTVRVTETDGGNGAASGGGGDNSGAGTGTLTEAQRAEISRFYAEEREKDRLVRYRDQKLNESKLDAVGCELVRGRLGSGTLTEATIDQTIKDVRDMLARQNPVRPNVPGSGGQTNVTESYDRLRERLWATTLPADLRRTHRFQNEIVEPFHSISEMLIAFEPDRALRWINNRRLAAQESLGAFQWGGGMLDDFVQEADLSTSTFAQAWADVLNRRIRQEVADPALDNWRQVISDFVNFADLTNTYKFVRVGELGILSSVNEGGTYPEISKETDDQEDIGISKYGGLYTLTWEAMLRDDVNVLARLPRKLGRAWAWTKHDTVWAILQLNAGAGPTMDADSTALYHNNHANIASSSFSDANLETVRAKMPVQTDPDSGKRKNYRARFLAFSTPSLDRAVWESLESPYKVPPTITNAGEVNLPNWIRSLQLVPIPVIYPTASTTRWELIANPADAPTMAAGFLGGREDPDVFIQDQETVGSRFTADKVTYKIRGTIGAAALDHRSFSRGNT